MVNRIDEVTINILKSATKEFSCKGFEKASMRTIAKNANVTTGALYARYQNKDALFGTLVEPIISKFLTTNDESNQQSVNYISNETISKVWYHSKKSSIKIVNLIYENKEIFTLLINCSNGSSYENFIDSIVEIQEKEIFEFLEIL